MWCFSQGPVQGFLFLPDDQGNKIWYLRLLSCPLCLKFRGGCWQFGGPEHRSGNWLPLFCCFTGIQIRNNFSVGWTQCRQNCKSTDCSGRNFLASTISLRRLLRQAQMLDYSVVKRLLPLPLLAPWFVVSQVCWQPGEEMQLLLRLPLPGACRPARQMWKSVRAPDSTLGAESSKTCQKTSPGLWWLLLLTQRLYVSFFSSPLAA